MNVFFFQLDAGILDDEVFHVLKAQLQNALEVFPVIFLFYFSLVGLLYTKFFQIRRLTNWPTRYFRLIDQLADELND